MSVLIAVGGGHASPSSLYEAAVRGQRERERERDVGLARRSSWAED